MAVLRLGRSASNSSRRTTALLCSSSCAANNKVTGLFRARSRISPSASGCRASSDLYRLRNSSQRSGLWPNHWRSAALGATSLYQCAVVASALLKPLGQRRSTRTRTPSLGAACAYSKLQMRGTRQTFRRFRRFQWPQLTALTSAISVGTLPNRQLRRNVRGQSPSCTEISVTGSSRPTSPSRQACQLSLLALRSRSAARSRRQA